MNPLQEYKTAASHVPNRYKQWRLFGAGLDSLSEQEVGLPRVGPDQLLVRHDACGICFSDVKIINLGTAHPRLAGRDMARNPVVMGHEVALTIVKVGESLKGSYKPGQRFIVQADIYYKGANIAYGYAIEGGMSQFGVVGKEILEGDEGSYLIPIEEETGYVEAALVEPWACVVAAYEYANYRDGVLDDGAALIYFANSRIEEAAIEAIFTAGHQPAVVETIADLASVDLQELARARTQQRGFDDILVFGSVSTEEIEQLSHVLARRGVMNLALSEPLKGPVTLDIGRIHYEQRLYVGGVVQNPAQAALAYRANHRKDLKPSGAVWFIGAGGPMGQMHVQRAVMATEPPKTIVVTDVNTERLQRVQDRFGRVMQERGIQIVLLNTQQVGPEESDKVLRSYGPFDDIVCLVPSADLVAQTAPYLAEDGVYNIFAGVNRGILAKLDLGTILQKRQRFIGTSGSSVADLKHTLELVEKDKLSTNSSLAAIGGMSAFRDGVAAVAAGAFPGKTVIFLHIEEMELTPIEELKDKLPSVWAKLDDGKFWTKAAEEELLRQKLKG